MDGITIAGSKAAESCKNERAVFTPDSCSAVLSSNAAPFESNLDGKKLQESSLNLRGGGMPAHGCGLGAEKPHEYSMQAPQHMQQGGGQSRGTEGALCYQGPPDPTGSKETGLAGLNGKELHASSLDAEKLQVAVGDGVHQDELQGEPQWTGDDGTQQDGMQYVRVKLSPAQLDGKPSDGRYDSIQLDPSGKNGEVLYEDVFELAE